MTIVDRDPQEAGRLAKELRAAAHGGATVEAAGPTSELRGEVLVLAVYYPGALELARELEGFGLLGITLEQPLGLDFQSTWKVAS